MLGGLGMGGLGQLGNFAGLLKHAQTIPGRLERVKARLGDIRETGAAGGGMVSVEVTGRQQVVSCTIEPQLITDGDAEVIQDLVVAATNDALAKVRQSTADAVRDETADMEVPGLSDMLSKFVGGGV